MKKAILILLMFSVLIIAGCGSLIDLKASSEVIKQFLNENPDADITMNVWSADEIMDNQDKVTLICGKMLEEKPYYYVLIEEKEQRIEAFLDFDTGKAICIKRVGLKDDIIIVPPESGDKITEEKAVELVKQYFHKQWYQVADGCGKYNDKTGMMEPLNVYIKETLGEGGRTTYLVYAETYCGWNYNTGKPSILRYTVTINGEVYEEGPTSDQQSDKISCEKKGGYWNECPMPPCPEGQACIQVCGEPRCEFRTTGSTSGCSDDRNPVCGIDGKTYQNICVAESNNIEIAYYGECGNAISEKVTCIFAHRSLENKCYSTDGLWSCSGEEKCEAYVKSGKGTKIMWKSKCTETQDGQTTYGVGYAETTIDGEDETVSFACAIDTTIIIE